MAPFLFFLRLFTRNFDAVVQLCAFVLTLVAVIGAYNSNPIYVTACGALAALGALWAFWRQLGHSRVLLARMARNNADASLPDLPYHNPAASTWRPYSATISAPRPRAGSPTLPPRAVSPTAPSTKGLEKQRLNYIQQSRGLAFEFRDKSDGPPHQPIWTSHLFVGGKFMGEGHHSSKKAAQDSAAAMALRQFDEEDEKADGGESFRSAEEGVLVDVSGNERAQE
ncbi:hypothetical protein BD626DRAFT_585038 [Schizophyllum amplum]|uniref:DRBM domain-containing protein n=1 Tax=Schizophyllum amplum TaxID=97359 RepID=A0A550C7A4_9AGAR|nr:hypothetical protein BD626DRAFT_585038 [Auriculariopsis ampla]